MIDVKVTIDIVVPGTAADSVPDLKVKALRKDRKVFVKGHWRQRGDGRTVFVKAHRRRLRS